MNRAARIEPVAWEVVTGHSYVLTEDDVFDGKNKLGMDIRHVPLNVPLCSGCDSPIPSHGLCENCEVLHCDIAAEQLVEPVSGDPFRDLAA